MSADTNISWTDHTFNPWWGCQRVSPGCEHCYAETMAKRVGHSIWGPGKTTPRRLFGSKHWTEPLLWDKAAAEGGVRKRVFCASMADVFEEHPMLPAQRERLWSLITATPNLDWLLLTKRPENVLRMIPEAWRSWMPRNIWLGTSVEDQLRAEIRVPTLMRLPVAVHFLSCEPLVGPVDLSRFMWWYDGVTQSSFGWVIAGGESGPGFRPMDLDWARALRDECVKHGVAFHFKQIGGLHHAAGGRELDGRTWLEFPLARELAHA